MAAKIARNGLAGHFHFPLHRHVTYLVRDLWEVKPRLQTRLVASGATPRFQIFVLTGINPTADAHALAIFRGASDSYVAACDKVEQMIRRTRAQTRDGQTLLSSWLD